MRSFVNPWGAIEIFEDNNKGESMSEEGILGADQIFNCYMLQVKLNLEKRIRSKYLLLSPEAYLILSNSISMYRFDTCDDMGYKKREVTFDGLEVIIDQDLKGSELKVIGSVDDELNSYAYQQFNQPKESTNPTKETGDLEEFMNTNLTAEEAEMLTQAKDFDARMKKAVKESTNPKPPTVEISLEDAKSISIVLHRNGFYQLGSIIKEAISKAEGKDPVNGPALPIQDQVNKLFELFNKLQDLLFKCQERESNMMDYSERLFERISKLEQAIGLRTGITPK